MRLQRRQHTAKASMGTIDGCSMKVCRLNNSATNWGKEAPSLFGTRPSTILYKGKYGAQTSTPLGDNLLDNVLMQVKKCSGKLLSNKPQSGV